MRTLLIIACFLSFTSIFATHLTKEQELEDLDSDKELLASEPQTPILVPPIVPSIISTQITPPKAPTSTMPRVPIQPPVDPNPQLLQPQSTRPLLSPTPKFSIPWSLQPLAIQRPVRPTSPTTSTLATRPSISPIQPPIFSILPVPVVSERHPVPTNTPALLPQSTRPVISSEPTIPSVPLAPSKHSVPQNTSSFLPQSTGPLASPIPTLTPPVPSSKPPIPSMLLRPTQHLTPSNTQSLLPNSTNSLFSPITSLIPEKSQSETQIPPVSTLSASSISRVPPLLPRAPPVLPSPCPPHKSLLTKEDIKNIIDYRVKTLSIYNYINNSYYSKAVVVRDKYLNDFNHFRNWYQNRPEHLKHNLEDIAFVRRHIEPFIKHTTSELKHYPHYLEEYDRKLNKTNKLLAKLKRYKSICENNCESKGLFRMSRKSDINGYYCSSIEELNRNTRIKLVKLAKNLISTMQNRITHDDKVFGKKIIELKNKLKDVALKEFGRTMYDILNLQDEYHHFIEDFLQTDVTSELYQIRQTHLLIDTKLMELEKHIEMYGIYCRTCNEISLRSYTHENIPMKTNRVVTSQNKENISKDVVDHLLHIKYEEIENSINNDYSNIFLTLNLIINNINPEVIYLTDLKPIQDEIAELLKKQRTNFEELKSIAGSLTVTTLVKLTSDSKKLLSKIQKEIDHLDQIYPKNIT